MSSTFSWAFLPCSTQVEISLDSLNLFIIIYMGIYLNWLQFCITKCNFQSVCKFSLLAVMSNGPALLTKMLTEMLPNMKPSCITSLPAYYEPFRNSRIWMLIFFYFYFASVSFFFFQPSNYFFYISKTPLSLSVKMLEIFSLYFLSIKYKLNKMNKSQILDFIAFKPNIKVSDFLWLKSSISMTSNNRKTIHCIACIYTILNLILH